MKIEYKIDNLKQFVESINKGVDKGRLEEVGLGIYFTFNGGLIRPNTISTPTSVSIFGTSYRRIINTYSLLGGLEKNAN